MYLIFDFAHRLRVEGINLVPPMHHSLVFLPLLLPLFKLSLQIKTSVASLRASDSPGREKVTLVGPRDKGDGVVMGSKLLLALGLVVTR